MPPIAYRSDATLEDATRGELTREAEIGKIPESWRVVTLGEIASELRSGITPKGGEKVYLQVGVPLIRSQNVLMNRLNLSDVAFIPVEMHKSMSGSAVQPGDVLLNITGASIGRVAFVPDELKVANVNQHVCRIRLVPDAVPEFVSYYLSTPHGQAQVMGSQFGTTRQGLNYGNVRAIRIPLPPIEEQRAIARALEAVREAREAREHELSLERERKAALMQYLFIHGTRGEETKQTEIGEMPESWRLTTLGEICEDELGLIQTGPFGSQLHASDYVQSGVPVVNPTHLRLNAIETSRLPHIGEELANNLSKHYLVEADILISRRGDFSRFAYIRSEQAGWLCGTGCLLVRLANPAIDNYFLAICMSLEPIQNYLAQAAVGSIMPNLNTRILSDMPAIVPGIEEQHRIAEVVRACEAKIAALEKEESLLGELFRAMLEELMTGRLSAAPLIEEHQTQ